MAAIPPKVSPAAKFGHTSRHSPHCRHSDASKAISSQPSPASDSSHTVSSFSSCIMTDRSTRRSSTTGNFLRGSRVTVSPGREDRGVSQARRAAPLITMAQAPQRFCRQLCSQATGRKGTEGSALTRFSF